MKTRNRSERRHRLSPGDAARVALRDVTVAVLEVDSAVTAIEQSIGGYPSSTPGASQPTRLVEECRHDDCANTRPCELHEPAADVELTGPERMASDGDRARADLEQLGRDLDLLRTVAARVARITHRWAYAGADEATVRQALVEIDSQIWCVNCSRFGRHEPRKEEHKECSFCFEFRLKWKRPAPAAVWEARDARSGRLDEATIKRVLDQLDRAREEVERRDERLARLRDERRVRLA